MSLPPLTLIPAGAGSGKTHTIQKQLAEWVSSGDVRPDRIVAVTFTEAAAGELRERIRTELASAGRVEDALRLERAYITTLHSFGLRLLHEFAFEAGMSPAPRLLGEDEERLLVGDALARTDRADAIMERLGHYGYRWNGTLPPEAQLRYVVAAVMGRLRTLGRFEEDPRLVAHMEPAVRAVYGPTADPARLERALRDAVDALLREHPRSLAPLFEGNRSATKDLRKNYAQLRDALESDALQHDWKLWKGLGELRTKGQGAFPEGYVERAEQVKAAAQRLPEHPGPLEDALRHGGALLGGAGDSLHRHAEDKRRRGLLDYTDMIAVPHQLLGEAPDVLESLCGRVDCVVIDEFQDTNPLQHALVWSLHEAGVPALVVGDVKQAIMSFQGADARLFVALNAKHPKVSKPLAANWRSQAPLMAFLNEVGRGLFPAEYTELAARAPFESQRPAVEVIRSGGRVKRGKQDLEAAQVARIRELLADASVRVVDRVSGEPRPIRGEDIAVLGRRHSDLRRLAQALREAGVRTRLREDGWFDSRAVQLACHALAYVTDPDERHAALYLAVTELGHTELAEGIRVLLDAGTLADPVLERLEPVRDGAADRTVATLLDDIFRATDLWQHIATWPDAAQARANLLLLRARAEEFGRADRDALSSGGYHGSEAKAFIAWLEGRRLYEDSQPPARPHDEDAVELCSWHAAKGREWPIVFVATTWRDFEPRVPDFDVEYEGFEDLAQVLDRARMVYSPSFDSKETKERFVAELRPREREEARRLLYVALTRARETLVLEWPEFSDARSGEPAPTYWHLLCSQAGLSLTGDRLRAGDHELECVVHDANAGAPGDATEPAAHPNPSRIGRRALEPRELPGELTPDAITPSTLGHTAERGEPPRVLRYAAPLNLEIDLPATQRGDTLHRCFEVLLAAPDRADKLEAATGYAFTENQQATLTRTANQFRTCLDTQLHATATDQELPVLALDPAGSVVSGVIDLVVHTPDGLWVIDHKSDQTDDRTERFWTYGPQLRAYADALAKARPEERIAGVGVHWVSYGEVAVLVELAGPHPASGDGVR